MRKVLLLLFLLMVGVQYCVQAQKIRVEQYTVLVERNVYRSAPCHKYIYASPDNPPTTGEWLNYPSASYPNNSRFQNFCYVEDEGCSRCPSPGDYLTLKTYNPTSGYTPVGSNIQIRSMQIGESRTYYDTLHYWQSPLPISKVQTGVVENAVYKPLAYDEDPNFNTDCNVFIRNSDVNVTGDLSEQTTYTDPYTNNYLITTTVRVVPSLDPTFNLPSHDKITMQTEGEGFTWQYWNNAINDWADISASFTTDNGKGLKISGYDLFGDGYVSHLNDNINFRVRNNSSGNVSDPVTFTLRLSSPHIISVTPTHLNCYERNEGSVKINFDRALLPAEKLNILLYDTLHRVNYSKFNLTELASDNSYTWPNELRSGIYYISLIGKYAKGLEYDLTVNSREGSPSTYVAMNSVNFEDGFNTPDVDDFNSFTDYSSYSQATYTGSLHHIAFKTLTQPEKIRFEAAVQNNVLCKGSATGSVLITATGGFVHDHFSYFTTTFKYSLKREGDNDYSPWVNFTNNNTEWVWIEGVLKKATRQLVTNLKGGKYSLRIRDEVDCYAKDSAGNEITYSFTITEPEKGITLDLFEVSPITSHDAANAQVKVQISGGTPFISTPEVEKEPYIVKFIKEGTSEELALTNTVLEANKRMQSVTGQLAEGDYILRIYDAYYETSPTDPGGCFLEMKIPIRKPDTLLVNIKSKRQISCYDSTDGKLLADATGGIQIDSLKYTFKWYKVTNEGNTLLADTDSLLENVVAGSYQVEVTDKYSNKKTSQTFTLTQPSQLQLDTSATEATCYSSSNGSAGITVTGGTPYSDGRYTYEWSTGDRTPTVNNLPGGTYMVVVSDSMFCMARKTVTVNSPVRVFANAVITPITCRGACDGQIAVSPIGGNVPYTYSWSTGATTSTISNLCPGTYWYTVTDAGGCYDSDTITISNSDTLFVNIGSDRKICIGQTIRLDATASDTAILTYNWQGDNNFSASTAKVAITQPGTYRVAVSNNGNCTVRDTITITQGNGSINTDFVVSTQAFVNESVTLVNISNPRTDSVKWIMPSVGNVIRPVLATNDKCELIFSDTGMYAMTMRAYYPSGCIDDSTKIVNVITRSGAVTSGNQANAYLKTAVIYPNPNNGNFTVDLSFSEVTRARLRLINTLTNVTIDDRLIQSLADYQLIYNVGLVSGVYMLVIDTSRGSFVYKVIIAH